MVKKKSNLMDERQSFKPFHYPWAYEAWLKHEQIHWLHTEGWWYQDPNARGKLNQKLNDPDWSYLRTADGRV